MLLTVDAMLLDAPDAAVRFEADAAETLHLRTDSGLVKWSTDGSNFTSDLDTDVDGPQTLGTTGFTSLTIVASSGFSKVRFQDFALVDVDLKVMAGDLQVDSNAVVSTRMIGGTDLLADPSTGDSGDISLSAQTITVQTGATLVAHHGGATQHDAGDITLKASDTEPRGLSALSIFGNAEANTATIDIEGATIAGGNIEITAEAEDDSSYIDTGSAMADLALHNLVDMLGQIPDMAVSSITGVAGQITLRDAVASVSIVDGSITGTDDVAIGSTANTDASLHTVSLNGVASSGKFALAVAYGEADSEATTTLDGVNVTADGTVDVTSSAVTKAYVKARTSTNASSGASSSSTVAIAVAIANTSEESHVTVTDGTTITSNNHSVNVDATGEAFTFPWAQPTVNDDGTTAMAFPLGFDVANVTVTVDGDIDAAGGVGDSFNAEPGNDVDYGNNTITITDHGFVDGERVTYSPGEVDVALGTETPPEIDGLKDRDDPDGITYYYVQIPDSSNPDVIQLTDAPTLAIDYSHDPGSAAPQHTLSTFATVEFESGRVDTEFNTIDFLSNHGLSPGQEVRYSGNPDPGITGLETGGVEGLEQGVVYTVDVLGPTSIRLIDEGGAIVSFTAAGNGTQALIYHDNTQTFSPETAIDSVSNSITFASSHGFSTGDAVIYRTDPTITQEVLLPASAFESSLSKLDSTSLSLVGNYTIQVSEDDAATLVVDGAEVSATVDSVVYDDINDLTTVTLDTGVIAGTLTRAAFQGTETYTELDAPLDELENELVYYIVRVDDTTIRLASNATAASDAEPIDIEEGEDLSLTGLGEAHLLLTSSCTDGICIHAGLSSLNSVNAASSIDKDSVSWTTAVQEGAVNPDTVIAAGASAGRKAAAKSNSDAQKNPAQSDASSMGIVGSIAVNYFDHVVDVTIGSNANLTSDADIVVAADIAQAAQVAATADTSKPKDSELAASVAIGVGVFNNSATTTVGTGAELDANGSIAVDAVVDYGFLIPNPLSSINPADYLESSGPEGWTFFNDGTLGFASNLFNTFVMTSANGADVSIGASLAVLIYDNDAKAIIQDGASINQLTDARFRDGPQTVNVNAETIMNLIHVVGVGALGLNFQGGINAIFDEDNKGISDRLKQLVNPFGAEGGKGGVGASLLVEVVDNHTEATIDSGALVHAGDSLSVTAGTDIFDFAFVQAGGKASSIGFSGAFAVAIFENTTLARIKSGADVESDGSIDISAIDDMTRVGITGAIVASESIGIGISVSVNYVDRDTQAYIGTAHDQSLGTDTTMVMADGPISISATTDGNLWTLGIAGTSAGTKPQETEVEGTQNDQVDGASSKAQDKAGVGGSSNSSDSSVTLGIAGDISVNVVTDTALAYINENKSSKVESTGDAIIITSLGATEIWSLSGSVAISRDQEKTSTGIAGSISGNYLTGDIRSFVSGEVVGADYFELDASSLTLSSRRRGGIRSLTAASATAPSDDGNAVAGSVSVNVAIDNVESYVRDTEVTLDDSSSLTAKNEVQIWAIGGAVGYGGSGGYGFAIAVNVLGTSSTANVTRAYIDNSDITIADGTLEVTATNATPDEDPRIIAITGSVGANSSNDSAAGAGTVSVNLIANDTEAYITGSSVMQTQSGTGEVDTSVSAADSSIIIAVSAAIAVSVEESVGAAVNYNETDNDVEAYLDDVDLTIDGTLSVEARSTSEIGGAAAGIAASTSSSNFTGAGSLTVNVITSSVNAFIDDTIDANSMITTGGDVTVSASDDSQIITVAGAVAGAPQGDASTGAAISYNLIQNTIRAYIEDATVTAQGTDSSVDVSATSDAVLIALTVAGAGGDDFALGASISVNSIANTVDAHILDATVTASGDVMVTASESNALFSVAGAVAVATGNTAVGGALAYNFIGGGFDSANPNFEDPSPDPDEITAYISDSTVTSGGDIVVQAGHGISPDATSPSISIGDITIDLSFLDLSSQIVSITVGAAVANSEAISGSFSVDVIAHHISAYIDGTSATPVTADGSVLVSALNELFVVNAAGSVSFSSTSTSVGVANSTIITDNRTRAFIGDNSVVQANGNQAAIEVLTGEINDNGDRVSDSVKGVIVSSISFEEINSVAAGGSASGGGSAIAGSATVAVLTENASASIGEQAKINQTVSVDESGNQSVVVRSGQHTNLIGVAGAISVSAQSGIGAGIDVTVLDKDTNAWIGSSAMVRATDDVLVDAFSQEDILSASAAIGAGNSSGIAGGVGVSVYTIDTRAYIGASASVIADNNVRVSAEQRTLLEMINGALGFGANGAVAGGIGVPVFDKTTEAYIGAEAIVDGRGLGSGVTVNSGDFLAFTGDTSQSGMIRDTDLDNSDIPVLDDPSFTQDRNATPDTISGFRGVAVTAVNSDQIEMYNIGAGGAGGSAAVSVALGLNIVTETTYAHINDGARINQDRVNAGDDQSVLVTAGNDFFTRAIGGALAGSGSAAATPGLELAFLGMDTQAWIGHSALVSASDDVIVTAFNEEDIIAVAVSIAGGGAIAGAGAVAVLDLDNTTHAYIENRDTEPTGAIVTAGGNVRLHAEDRSDVDLIAGGAGGGISAGGVGISLGIALIDKSTQAYVGDDAVIDAKGDGATFAIFNGNESGGAAQTSDIVGVGISAFSEEDLFNLAVAGAAGLGFAVAGSVTIDQFNSDTKAFTSTSATINVRDDVDADPNQDVYVTAVNKMSATSIVGALAGSAGASVGAGVDVGSIANETEARLGGTVSAARDVRVAATSDREIFSVGVAGSVGTIGLSGGISFWTIGKDVDGSYVVDSRSANTLSNDRDFNEATEQSLDDSNNTDLDYEASGSPNRGDNSNRVAGNANGVLDVFKSFTDALVDSTTSHTKAVIEGGADVKAGRDVVVQAREEFFSNQTAGGISLSIAGVGAGLGQVLHASQTEARILGATVDVGRHLTVDASSFEEMRLLSIAGTGAIIGFAAGYAEIDAKSDQVASIGTSANIKNAQSVTVTADHVRRFDAVSGGGSVGAIAAGLAATQVEAGGTVLAVIDDDTLLGEIDDQTQLVTGTVGDVTVEAASTVEGIQGQSAASAEATAVSGGILAGSGAISRINLFPTVLAAIDVRAEVHSSGIVDVTARTDMDVIAETFGIQAGGVTIGLSSASALIQPLVNAVIATDAIVEGTAITVAALHNVSAADGSALGGKAKADAFSASGSLLGFVGATSAATSSATVRVDVSRDSSMLATTGDIVIRSESSNRADADADGRALGFAGIGRNSANASIDTTNEIIVLFGATIESREGNVSLSAASDEDADANSVAGDGGVLATSATGSSTDVDNLTRVSVGSGARIEAEQTLTLVTASTTDADADARATNSGLDTDTSGTSTVSIDIVVDSAISGATLVGKDVVMGSTVTSVDGLAFGRGNSEFALDTDAVANATMNSNVATTIGVGGSAQIEGLDSVTLMAEQLEMITESFADANADSLGGTATASSTTLQTTDTSVTAGSSATIITQSLDVQANAPSAPDASAESAADGAVIGDESNPTVDAIRLRRDISFDATVIIVAPSRCSRSDR